MRWTHLARAATALAVFSVLACQSDGGKDQARGKPEPFVPLPDTEPDTIGYFLTRFDGWLARWSELKLSAAGSRDRNELTALESHMHQEALERRDELLTELESGSPLNRRIAAAALGFSHDPTVLSPLLSAVSDRDHELVQKALLAIGVLALPETPLGEILQRLEHDPEAWTRNNAAFAVLSLARAGNESRELVAGCRAALDDSEPGVRAQCASSLGELADAGSVEPLSALLLDESNLVALASAVSLANIGQRHPEQKGAAARKLARVLDQVRPDRRAHVLTALRWLSNDDFGEDAAPWLEWAHKLP